MSNPHEGQKFSDFLMEEGIYEEVSEAATKRILSMMIDKAMKDQKLSKAEMARRMKTSPNQIRRLLDPEDTGVTLHTLTGAAQATGSRLVIGFEPLQP